MARVDDFLNCLYREKELHKEQRHKHVIHKLVLASSFFGLGQLAAFGSSAHLFLYVVPLVALVHDLYIFAEDFKVKRIGYFIKNAPEFGATVAGVCQLEIEWEKRLERERDPWAFVGSLTFTILIILFSAVAVYLQDFRDASRQAAVIFATWLSVCAVLTVLVFVYARSLKHSVIKTTTESLCTHP